MGFFDKLFPGKNDIDDEDDIYGEDSDDYIDFPEDEAPQPSTHKQSPAYNQTSQRSTGISGALEMKVVKPERYDSATARKIAAPKL